MRDGEGSSKKQPDRPCGRRVGGAFEIGEGGEIMREFPCR